MTKRTTSGLDNVPAGLEIRRFPPRFVDPEVERQHLRDYAQQMRPQIRFGLLTAVVLWIGVTPLGFWLTEGSWSLLDAAGAVILLVMIATPALAATRLQRFIRALPWFTTLANLVTGISCVFLGYVVMNQPMLTVGGLIICTTYAATFFRLGFVQAVIATVPYLGGMCVLTVIDPSLRGADTAIITFLLMVTELTALSAVYVNDHASRRAFVQRRVIELQQRELAEERAKSDRLLLNVLPAAIATRLRQKQETIAETYPEVTILFSDVVGFTPLADKLGPAELVNVLNRLFSKFDELAAKHGLEKIKTIGDAYMAAAGVPLENPDHAASAAQMALEMMDALAELNREFGLRLEMRIGLNTGTVIAGVIGKQKFSYDLWGDAVNTAARMESHGVAGQVQISETTREKLGSRFAVEDRGVVEVKGKGQMHTWLLRGRGAGA